MRSIFRVFLSVLGLLYFPLALSAHPAGDPELSRLENGWRRLYGIAALGGRYGHSSVAFNDRIWVIGGYTEDRSATDVWSSEDGMLWTRAVLDAGFSPREGQACLADDKGIWLFGGAKPPIYAECEGNLIKGWKCESDIWFTADGTSWERVAAKASYSPRMGHACLKFGGRYWILGGFNGKKDLADVWSSGDGSRWERVTQKAPFGPRVHASLIEFDSKMWVIGGSDKDDVWRSVNGVEWKRMKDLPFRIVGRQVVFVHAGRIWIINGTGSTNDSPYGTLPEAWVSQDGGDWQKAQLPVAFLSRSGASAVAHDRQAWLVGGNHRGDLLKDVWKLDSVGEWHWANFIPRFIPQHGAKVVPFNGAIWMLGGEYRRGLNTIWASEDGIDWKTIDIKNSIPYWGALPLVFQKKLWMIGGNDGESVEMSFSEDGKNWTRLLDLFPKDGTEVIGCVFRSKMWVMPKGPLGKAVAVWNSSDGERWECVLKESPIKSWSELVCLSFKGRMWVFGSRVAVTGGGSDQHEHQIFRSEDGKEWEGIEPPEGLRDASVENVIEYNGKMVALGSGLVNGERINPIWISDDGKNWEKMQTKLPFLPRSNFSSLGYDGRIWIWGGWLHDPSEPGGAVLDTDEILFTPAVN